MNTKDNILIADTDKTLYFTPEDKVWGRTARLGAKYKDWTLSEDLFKEVQTETIDGIEYSFEGKSYAEIKTLIIKLHYTNDDQIALMLNYQLDPEVYAESYNKMQEWRAYADSIAKKYTNKP